ncbi:LamG domain-containing protein [Paenibacillus sp.]|uniref:LamG domain-containing protein n=1 Tax=Paenibacillus sp. TaxID=58172 RepID=UPI002D741EA9|nr:LamG domain-containing protein [Paenibacillus sp.]HZG83826.1 LamG domain-containing protein [Paenibacillus sp.]
METLLSRVSANRYALSFDGVDDYVTVPDSPVLRNFTNQITIEMWVKPNLISGNQSFLRKDNAFILQMDASGRFRPHVFKNGGYVVAESPVGTISQGTLQHIALVYDGSNLRGFLNGAVVCNAVTSGDLSVPVGSIFIGSRNGTGEFFKGVVDDVRIWNVARTASEIADNMNRMLAGNEAGLVGYWKFDEGGLNPLTLDFGGKVAGSTTENPNIFRGGRGASLYSPSQGSFGDFGEVGQTHYGWAQNIDGQTSIAYSTNTNTYMNQHMFSWNVIEEILRKRGNVFGSNVLADRVAWAKNNIQRFTADWYGRGTGPSGNRANFSNWDAVTSSWVLQTTHTGGSISRLFATQTTNAYRIVDSNGFMHFLAYADAASSTVASTVYTDYVRLTVDFKNTAIDSSPNGNNGTIYGATYVTDMPVLYYAIDVETGWTANDEINFEDFNRLETNIKTLRSYLADIQYAIPAITTVTNRTMTYIDFLSSINRIEQNLETIRTNFATPPGYPGAETWAARDGFDYTDANRLETDVMLLFETAGKVYDSFVYCGTFAAGYERGGIPYAL